VSDLSTEKNAGPKTERVKVLEKITLRRSGLLCSPNIVTLINIRLLGTRRVEAKQEMH
jgi:hypothetical protein